MILVDAHVHIYDCFDLEKFFDSAYSNFKNAAVRSGCGDDFIGILMLAETVNEHWFDNLSSYAYGKTLESNANTGNWRFHRTDERCSLVARSDDNRALFIIAGRQFVTAEGLEVLSLASTNALPEGLPIRKLIANVRDTGGIPVIPWGFGKWLGKRGAILKQLLDKVKEHDLFLGDNSGRPIFWRPPGLFKKAKKKGIPVLPGSDPLPFGSEYHRVGKFGFMISGILSSERPAKDFKGILLKSSGDLQPYGRLERAFSFFYNQYKLRLASLT